MFPQQIGVGATWDPALAEKMGESTSSTMRATGVFWNFAPVSDLSRDTRWGRYYETLSEDPTLAGSLSRAVRRHRSRCVRLAARVVRRSAVEENPVSGCRVKCDTDKP